MRTPGTTLSAARSNMYVRDATQVEMIALRPLRPEKKKPRGSGVRLG